MNKFKLTWDSLELKELGYDVDSLVEYLNNNNVKVIEKHGHH